MKRFSSISIALVSLACAMAVAAATRPHYGGTLRVAVADSPQSFDPASADSPALRSLSQLAFETLVKFDSRGRLEPLLASTWQVEPGNQRWRFQVRGGVLLSDGTPLDANTTAASLRASNPQWKVFALGDLVMIETDAPDASVPAELALARNSIARRNSDGSLTGTGPFTVAKWDAAAKHMTLAANDQYWAGRPFIDSVEVDFGKSYRDQLMALDLGKSDLVEIAPEAIRAALAGNRAVLASQPEELLALVFSHDVQSNAEMRLRTALSSAIDRPSLSNVVFQGGGEPTGALLPNWLTGYGFVFSIGGGSRERGLQQRASLTLSYDVADPLARILADRILLNAKDAGIVLQATNGDNADMRLARIQLPSLNPQLVLIELARKYQLSAPTFADASIAAEYSAENTMLQTRRIIPLLHLRSGVAIRSNVHAVAVSPDGTWDLSGSWLSPETP
ncbi:MAG TPA: ABC transporter substrate-binding protein [Terriglobales bacterium]|nr:ABC transporter substrate-binding protein [Terriglobales bacterium]